MKHLKTLLPLAFAATLLPGAAIAQLAPGPKVVIQAVTQATPTLPQYTRVDQPILRDGLAKASNGRIEVVLSTWPERNVSGPEVLRLVRSGQIDISTSPLTTVSGDVPILDGIDLAGLSTDIHKARRIADGMMPLANKELQRLGIKLVATFPFTAQMFYCRKPINSLNDLKGLRIRTNGPSTSDLLKGIGAQPVSIAFGEVYTALERGTLDCSVSGASAGSSANWAEVSSHLYSLPLSWSVAGYFVNLAWWEKLDPGVRALMEKTFADVQNAQWALGLEANTDGIACNVGRNADCKIHKPVRKPMVENKPQAEAIQTVHQQLTESVLPGWFKRCGDKCLAAYKEVIAPVTGIPYTPR
ncbi:TRAP transporter substrate-binding protein DctP [Hydrogenophaga sp. BPS33]|uniref:TRAP transporter substrate-binding protein DctP n=1 Tax=Hydrogenophaga sp. BPS33 TaxID=2651974 RepID=UPI00135BDDB7|nr:TRAP transporter substrate-binding protein DctP [Hydrogenophaga sp. BPS33]